MVNIFGFFYLKTLFLVKQAGLLVGFLRNYLNGALLQLLALLKSTVKQCFSNALPSIRFIYCQNTNIGALVFDAQGEQAYGLFLECYDEYTLGEFFFQRFFYPSGIELFKLIILKVSISLEA